MEKRVLSKRVIKQKNWLILSIVAIALIMGLSACTVNLNLGEKNESSSENELLESWNEKEDEEVGSEVEKNVEESTPKKEAPVEESTPKEEEKETKSENLSLDDAKKRFAEEYPNATIDVAKTEGNAYYVQGYEGSDICKMKILSADGSIVLNKRITTGRGRNYGG